MDYQPVLDRIRAEVKPMIGKGQVATYIPELANVSPSHFGIAVVEALAAGCPVLISDEVEVQETIATAGVGEVISLDRSATSAALLRWLADEELRRETGKRARGFAAEHFDWQKIAARWLEHYERLVH